MGSFPAYGQGSFALRDILALQWVLKEWTHVQGCSAVRPKASPGTGQGTAHQGMDSGHSGHEAALPFPFLRPSQPAHDQDDNRACLGVRVQGSGCKGAGRVVPSRPGCPASRPAPVPRPSRASRARASRPPRAAAAARPAAAPAPWRARAPPPAAPPAPPSRRGRPSAGPEGPREAAGLRPLGGLISLDTPLRRSLSPRFA